MQEALKEIRKRLRLSMNGVVSASMRKKGLDYRLNFGVTIPQLKRIAADFTSGDELATLLWKQDVREMKILATLLQPTDSFTKELATQWIGEVSHPEIAEQLAMNLLANLPFAPKPAVEWIRRKEGYYSLVSLLLFTRLFMKNAAVTEEQVDLFLYECRHLLDSADTLAFHPSVVMTALKRLGCSSPENAVKVLACFSGYQTSGSEEKGMLFDELEFEFKCYSASSAHDATKTANSLPPQ